MRRRPSSERLCAGLSARVGVGASYLPARLLCLSPPGYTRLGEYNAETLRRPAIAAVQRVSHRLQQLGRFWEEHDHNFQVWELTRDAYELDRPVAEIAYVEGQVYDSTGAIETLDAMFPVPAALKDHATRVAYVYDRYANASIARRGRDEVEDFDLLNERSQRQLMVVLPYPVVDVCVHDRDTTDAYDEATLAYLEKTRSPLLCLSDGTPDFGDLDIRSTPYTIANLYQLTYSPGAATRRASAARAVQTRRKNDLTCTRWTHEANLCMRTATNCLAELINIYVGMNIDVILAPPSNDRPDRIPNRFTGLLLLVEAMMPRTHVLRLKQVQKLIDHYESAPVKLLDASGDKDVERAWAMRKQVMALKRPRPVRFPQPTVTDSWECRQCRLVSREAPFRFRTASGETRMHCPRCLTYSVGKSEPATVPTEDHAEIVAVPST